MLLYISDETVQQARTMLTICAEEMRMAEERQDWDAYYENKLAAHFLAGAVTVFNHKNPVEEWFKAAKEREE